MCAMAFHQYAHPQQTLDLACKCFTTMQCLSTWLIRGCVLQCDAINGGLPTYTWKIRLSFLVYVIAVETTIGEPVMQLSNTVS